MNENEDNNCIVLLLIALLAIAFASVILFMYGF